METDDILDLMRNTAAEFITPRFQALATGEIFEKSPGDLVTVADREAELALTPVLAQAYPHAVILGEEATEADPSLLHAYSQADHAFTIDPVDGTGNFVRGSADHAVMIAELRRGEVVRGWIWQPEHRLAFVAEKGAGSWCNGTRLPALAPATEPSQWHGICSIEGIGGGTFAPLAPLRPTRMSAGIDYCRMACGEVDFAVFNQAKAWDHAPGALLITELGGDCVRYDGSRYLPAQLRHGLIASASPEISDGVRAALGQALA